MILNQTALVLIGLLVAAWTLAAGWAILSARVADAGLGVAWIAARPPLGVVWH